MGDSNKTVSFTVAVKDAASAALKQVENAATGVGQKLFSLKDIVGGFVGAFAAFKLTSLVKDMIDLGAASDKAMRQISANLPTGVAGLAKLRGEITALGVESGRSLQEMQSAAVQIAHLGVGSADEVAARLKAATELSDATGTGLTETVDGLDQLMDAFNLNAEQAEGTLAKLVSASKGRVDIEAVFAAFQKATPTFQKFNIDADTATKAIVALLDAGHSAKKVGGELAELDAAGIREIATHAKISTTALDDLRKASDLVRGSAQNTEEALKTKFAATLQELGTNLIPLVNGAMEVMSYWLDVINNKASKGDLASFLATAKEAGALLQNRHFGTAPGSAGAAELDKSLIGLNTAAQSGTLYATSITAKDAAQIRAAMEQNLKLISAFYAETHNGNAMSATQVANISKNYAALADILGKVDALAAATATAKPASAPLVMPLTEAQKKQIATDVAFAQKAIADLGQSTQQVLSGATKGAADNALVELSAFRQQFLTASAELKQRIESAPDAATKASLQQSLASLTDQYLAGASARLDRVGDLGRQEADTLKATIGTALQALTGDLATNAQAAIDAQAKSMQTQIDLNVTLSDTERKRLTDQVALWKQLKPAVDAAEESIAKSRLAIQAADAATPGTASTAGLMASSFDLIQRQAELVKLGGEGVKNSQKYRDLEAQRLAIGKELEKLGKQLGVNTQISADHAKEAMQATVDQARAIRDAVDGALQLANAFGLVDENTVNILRNIGEVATQIPVLASQLSNLGKLGADGKDLATLGSIATAALPIIGGVASLVSSMFGESPEEKAHIKTLEDNTAALAQLTKVATLGGFGGMTGAQSSSAAALLAQYLHGSLNAASRLVPISLQNPTAGNRVESYNTLSPEQQAELNATAKALGITLDGTRASFEQLEAALAKGTPLLGKFGSDFASMMGEIDAETKIFGDSGPDGGLAKIMSHIGPLSKGISSLFEGIDFSKALTPEELEQIRTRVKAFFALMEGGGLTADQLGGLNGSDFLSILEQISSDLDQLGTNAQAAADAVRAAKEATLQAAVSGASDYDSIHNITDPTKLFAGKAAAYAGAGGALGDLFKGFDLNNLSADDIAKLDTSFQDLFDKLQTSPDTVDLAGLSLDDLKKALLDLNSSAQSVAAGIQTAAEKMAAAESKLSDDFNIYGTDATGQANAYANLYGFDLSGFDLATQGGKDSATKYLQDLYGQHPELAKQIENTLGAVRNIALPAAAAGGIGAIGAAAVGGSTSSIAAGFQGLTTIQGDRMSDELLQIRRGTDMLFDIRDLLYQTMKAPSFSPVSFAAAAQALGSSSAGSGGLVINGLTVHVTTDKEDAKAQGTDAADAFAQRLRELDIGLGRKTQVQKLYNGNIRVTGS